MTANEHPFHFSPAWHSLGIVTESRLAALRAELALDEDRSPEHYRWQAFEEFVAEHYPLSASLAESLYELGARETDVAIDESIMHAIAALSETRRRCWSTPRHPAGSILIGRRGALKPDERLRPCAAFAA